MEVYSSDNAGHRVSPHANLSDPILASGLSAAAATAGADYTQTVVAGESYACTAKTGMFLISATGVTSTAANIEWVCPVNETIVIKVPVGVTTLYFEADTNTSTLYMRKLTVA